jgi:hypothetical protein
MKNKMKYSIEEIGFILYNNRSPKCVSNFLNKNWNPLELIKIEKKFDWSKSLYSDLEKMVEVDLSLLNPEEDDVLISPDDLSKLGDFIKLNAGKYSDEEKNFLLKRKIPLDVCDKWGFLGLSNFKNKEDLVVIGATCHPILKEFLKDGIDEGGIVQPLFQNGVLTNCSIRRISDVGKLKYTLAVPDIPVWGLDDIENEEVWICEGLFDMICLRELGIKAVSPSSAMWSGPQLYQLLEKNPKNIVIFCDNDRVGLKTGMVMQKFFNLSGTPSITIHSKEVKDACEHFWERGLTCDELETIKITREMVEDKNDDSFNFLKYLQNRKF